MLGDLTLPRNVFGASHLIGENDGEQIFGEDALQRWGELAPIAAPWHRQTARAVPAPAHREHGGVEECLHEHLAHGAGVQVLRHLGQGEAVRGAEGDDDGVLRRRCLQLDVELAAEALAQC